MTKKRRFLRVQNEIPTHQYRGELTIAQIADGINASNENAKRLAEDARLLYNNQRYPTALSIAVLSIEEWSKEGMLRSLLLGIYDADRFWKAYRNHLYKTWVMSAISAQNKNMTFNNFADLFLQHAFGNLKVDETLITPSDIELVKQLGFYTDCLHKGPRWIRSQNIIRSEWVEPFVGLAEDFIAHTYHVTVEDLELYRAILGPVCRSDRNLYDEAEREYIRLAEAKGLRPPGL